MSGSGEGRPRPRWDPDDRGVGVGDARAHIATVDALREVADRDGWVARRFPELVRHVISAGPHIAWSAPSGVLP